MRQIINVLLRLPKWYGLTIILIYSVMIAEFVKVLNTLFMVGGIEKVALMEKIVQLNLKTAILIKLRIAMMILWPSPLLMEKNSTNFLLGQ